MPKIDTSSQKINDNGDLLISETKNYKVIYFPKNNQVFVSILSSPFSKFREEAEKELLEVLDIDSDTSCKLNVLITTPRFVNPEEAGKEDVLSFCGWTNSISNVNSEEQTLKKLSGFDIWFLHLTFWFWDWHVFRLAMQEYEYAIIKLTKIHV